jgi:hypothetical protein
MVKVEAQRHFYDLDRRITRRTQDETKARVEAERLKKAPYEAAFAEVDAEIRRLDKLPGPVTKKQNDLSARRDRLREALFQIGQGKEPDGRLLRKDDDEPELDLKGFTRTPQGNGSFDLSDGNMRVRVEPTDRGKFQATFGSAKSSPHLQGEQAAVDWAAQYRKDATPADATPADAAQQEEDKPAHLMTEAEFGQREKDRAVASLEQDHAQAKKGNFPQLTYKSKAQAVRETLAAVERARNSRPENYAGDHLAIINRAREQGQDTTPENLRRYALEPLNPPAAAAPAPAAPPQAEPAAAPAPADDRDHFTLERLNRDTDKMEPVTFGTGSVRRTTSATSTAFPTPGASSASTACGTPSASPTRPSGPRRRRRRASRCRRWWRPPTRSTARA